LWEVNEPQRRRKDGKTEDGRQKTEDRRRTTDDGRWKTEGRGRMPDAGCLKLDVIASTSPDSQEECKIN
jgi:hypothetical protein